MLQIDEHEQANISALRSRVYEIMAQLPQEKVTTYGDVAAIAGFPRSARAVGVIARGGPEHLPWHRLVNARGELATGFPGGRNVQMQLLAQDGIDCDEARRVSNFLGRRWVYGES